MRRLLFNLSSQRLFVNLRSQIRYKIIFPFLGLALIVAVIGAFVSYIILAGSSQDRFDNLLAQVARSASDTVVDQERANLVFLQEATLALRNESTGAPAVADAVADGDAVGLGKALDPLFTFAPQRLNVRLDRMIAFGTDGRTIVDWERPTSDSDQKETHESLDLSQTWFVPKVLAAGKDSQGDKFAGLLLMPDTNAVYLATIAPIKQGDEVVGGMISGMRIDSLLNQLREQSQAAIVTVYDGNGKALYSTTRPANGLAALNMDQKGLERLRATDNGKNGALYRVMVNEREYQFAYMPLQVRGSTIGILSVALSRDSVVNSVRSVRTPVVTLTLFALFAIFVTGVFIAGRITAPLKELETTASAVTAGELGRRSRVTSVDEVGRLADSFNLMTEHLLEMFNERAAIVESIVDGIVVCDNDGKIQSINQAMRSFLKLEEGQAPPEHFADLPLEQLHEMPGFSELGNLFQLNDRIVRAAPSAIDGGDGVRVGIVCVLQDMTAEVAINRAKTNFIATISHELRTPLTVLRGNADLLLRGMIGQLDPEQRAMIETMRNHAANMATLVSNVIVIADLDSGSIVPEPVATDLHKAIDDVIWPMRSQITAKGLEMRLDIPDNLPPVMVDVIHLRTVLSQLLDNARRYTREGTVTIRAVNTGTEVRVDVIDTGRGVSEVLHDQLFDRFIRGNGSNEGINSSERGIGLGLAIAKQLVERQGGRIWLEATSEQGSTFSFTLIHANNTPQLDHSTQAAA